MTDPGTIKANPRRRLQRDGVVSDAMRVHASIGLAAIAILVGGMGVWAANTSIAGAIVAPGTVVVETNVKKVQHPTGGVVGGVFVRNGDRVEAGSVLLRLDETVTRAALLILRRQLDELAIRTARLKAERDTTVLFALPASLEGRGREREIMETLAGERSLLASRRAALDGLKAQLSERIAQLEHELSGLGAQREAKQTEVELVSKELEVLTKLHDKQLISTAKYTAIRRDAARIRGEHAQLTAAAAQKRGQIAEIALQSLQIEQDQRRDVIKEMRELEAKQIELEERRVVAEDQLHRVEIRAPQSGVVHQLSVNTAGEVIGPSEVLMLIVPQADALVIDARIAPQDIDQVRVGQPALVRLLAFNQSTTPEVLGRVVHAGADLTRESQTGASWFTARIALPYPSSERHQDVELKPGMPVEVYLATRDRTVLSYLVKPLSDQVRRAFREE